MGQFSAEKPVPPGSTLSGNQQSCVFGAMPRAELTPVFSATVSAAAAGEPKASISKNVISNVHVNLQEW